MSYYYFFLLTSLDKLSKKSVWKQKKTGSAFHKCINFKNKDSFKQKNVVSKATQKKVVSHHQKLKNMTREAFIPFIFFTGGHRTIYAFCHQNSYYRRREFLVFQKLGNSCYFYPNALLALLALTWYRIFVHFYNVSQKLAPKNKFS